MATAVQYMARVGFFKAALDISILNEYQTIFGPF